MSRLAEYRSKMSQLAKALEVTAAEIERTQQQLSQHRKRLKLVEEIEGLHGSLHRQANSSRVQFLEAKDARLQVETQVFESRDRLSELRLQEQQQHAEQRTFKATWKKAIIEEMGEVRLELGSLQQRLDKAAQLNELVVLRAPADGIVLEVAERSAGSVAKEAEPLVTLVPATGGLEAEVDIPASDIGRIRVGDSVAVKLDAFPFQRHGTISAEVRTISEDAFDLDAQAGSSGGAAAVYKTRVALGSSAVLNDVPESFRLIPGMKLSAEVRIGSRRVITYLIYPVLKAVGESLREP